MNRNKTRVIELKNRPCVLSSASAVGTNEATGPLGNYFDIKYSDDGIGEQTWEKAESRLLKEALMCAIEKSSVTIDELDMIFAGDLLNQCTSGSYAVRNMNIAFGGLFGACSTMAYSLALAALLVDGGYCNYIAAATSSHFCSAEKQFRYPLEYGCQRSPSSQRTVTGAGAFIIGNNKKPDIAVSKVLFGKVVDLGVTDTANMGAAMAPAAAESISEFLSSTNTLPEDYDLILTGDLGMVGSSLMRDIIKEQTDTDISPVHNDCGLMIYDMDAKGINSGGSGCGCSACVTASYIMSKMKTGNIKKVLFAATGALMSPTLSLQGESIPGICHIVEFIKCGG